LDKGADFAKLAEENSTDPGSAQNGGDLDWANPNSFVPEFSEAMVQLKKGEYTKAPVKSQFGYHIILVTDTRESNAPPLEQVKEQLRERLLNDKWEAYQETLYEKAEVK
ncbi:MAG: peptidylprolyl isomerase, partial [Limnobacter sp.]|nr:peptidylprolyl isomerase [Limnobacter sp.]